MKYYAEADIWELINSNPEFNNFIGKCATHFEHFVIPRRDQDCEITQDYRIPENIDAGLESYVLLRWNKGNDISIDFCKW